MNLHLEGATKLYASRQEVYDRFTNPANLAASIPGREEARAIGESKVEATVAIPEAGGTFEVEMAVAETDPPSSARLTTKGSGPGGSLTVVSDIDLLGDSPTWIHWRAEAELKGPMAAIDQHELKSLADRKVEEIYNEVARAVEGQPR